MKLTNKHTNKRKNKFCTKLVQMALSIIFYFKTEMNATNKYTQKITKKFAQNEYKMA